MTNVGNSKTVERSAGKEVKRKTRHNPAKHTNVCCFHKTTEFPENIPERLKQITITGTLGPVG